MKKKVKHVEIYQNITKSMVMESDANKATKIIDVIKLDGNLIELRNGFYVGVVRTVQNRPYLICGFNLEGNLVLWIYDEYKRIIRFYQGFEVMINSDSSFCQQHWSDIVNGGVSGYESFQINMTDIEPSNEKYSELIFDINSTLVEKSCFYFLKSIYKNFLSMKRKNEDLDKNKWDMNFKLIRNIEKEGCKFHENMT